jgi:hypothetical protein
MRRVDFDHVIAAAANIVELDADLVDRDILLERADDLPIAVERRSTIRQRLGIL